MTAVAVTTSPKLGSYRLIAELGHGGMADVFLAAAEGPVGCGFTKLAVVKKLRDHLVEDPEFVSMLLDEARITARLTHPNVVQLFEVGQVDDQYFLAMEYLDGQPLHRIARRIERRAARGDSEVPREVFYAIVADVLAGLHHAHELKDYDGAPLEVVHRDVTPHNVFVTYDGAIKVVDFGIAKAAGRLTSTEHGIVKGKIRYMSPEQAAGGDVDRRTDVFAAGVMLWNAATGAKLWADLEAVAVAHALYAGNYPASPRELFPEVPVEIDAICRKALAFRREDRYATARDMRSDLEAFLGPSSGEARKKLASMMKELFAAERTQVRAVIEASGLTGTASIEALTTRRPGVAVMAEEDAPSVSPMAVPALPRADGAEDGGRVTSSTSRKPARRRVVAAVVAVAAAAVLAISARGAITAASGFAAAPRAAVVASDRATFSGEVRTKAERSEPVITLTKARVERGIASRDSLGKRAVSAARPTAPITTAQEPANDAAREAPKGVAKVRPPAQPPLDKTDPWTGAATIRPAPAP